MPEVRISGIDDWQARFKRVEITFFELDEEKWRWYLHTKIKNLGKRYVDALHATHVDWLNHWFRMTPPLAIDDFSGETLLRDLRKLVGRRLDEPETKVNLRGTHERLTQLGLGHLLTRE